MKARLDVAVTDLGHQKLKNIVEPMRAYSVEVGKPAERPKPAPIRRGSLVPALAALASLIVVAAAAWHFVGARPSTTTASSDSAPSVRSGVPTIAILPFANATGNPQYDPLAQRISQKTRDAAGNETIWRIVGRSGGAADPIEVGRQLHADYVVTGDVEAGGDALRVTFQVDNVHSGARLWSRTISPILESANAPAAEDEIAGSAVRAIERRDPGC